MLKIVLLVSLIPYFAMADQENNVRIQIKIYKLLQEMRDMSNTKRQHTCRYYYLYGKLDAYYEELNYELQCVQMRE